MASVKDYWTTLRDMGRQMAPRFGFDLQRSSVEIRGLAALTAVEFAVIVKILVDKGVVTDSEVAAYYADARDNNTWDPEPVEPPDIP